MNDEEFKEKAEKLAYLSKTGPLKNAIKSHISTLQPLIDSMTSSIYEFIKEDVENAIKTERHLGFRDLPIVCAFLTPVVQFSGNDIAPDYDFYCDVTWTLGIVVEDQVGKFTLDFWLDAWYDSPLYDKVTRLAQQDIHVTKSISRSKSSLVLEYIEKHNMVERFGVLNEPTIASKFVLASESQIGYTASNGDGTAND